MVIEVVADPVTVSVPTLSEVLVAFVVVELSAVKFCRVEEPVARILAALNRPLLFMFPALSKVANRLVELAVVAKRLVVVALVTVAFPPIVRLPTIVVEAFWNTF